MLRKYITSVLVLLCCIVFAACSQRIKKASSQEDISLMISVVKTGLTDHYFDKQKAAYLVGKLEEMEKQKVLEKLSPDSAAKIVTKMLRKETNDKHFSVIAAPKQPKQGSIPQVVLPSSGISKYRILTGNIGYIKWDLCLAGDEAFKQIRLVLDSLSGCDKLIFDITDNPGGDGASSAFINQFLYRNKDYQTLLRKKCTGEKEWHQSEVIFNYTEGPVFFDKPVYIIASDRTFSASEYFALTAKEMKRATILGKTTAGAGNPGTSQGIALPNSDIIFWTFIPNCQIVTKDGYSLEGRGVKPDVELKTKDWLNETLNYIAKQ